MYQYRYPFQRPNKTQTSIEHEPTIERTKINATYYNTL